MELELVGCFRGKNQNGSCDINIEGEAVARLAFGGGQFLMHHFVP